MKHVLVFLFFLPFALSGQIRLIDHEGEVTFFSDAPLEDIKATTKKAVAILDTSNGKVAIAIQMKSFTFAKALMQEHFNENYVESDKYPKAVFSGTITENIDYSEQGEKEVKVSGEMTLHGVTKPVEAIVHLNISKKKIDVRTVFNITVADYDIEIPSLVVTKIAEVVEVTATFTFDK